MKKFAWTIFYTPFILGGNVNKPTGAYVDVKETKEIRGFKFFTFETSNGTTRVCEESSGGIVARSFDELLENIKDSSDEELQEQIKQGYKPKHEITVIDTEDFLRYIK